jgi:hypothetical protein
MAVSVGIRARGLEGSDTRGDRYPRTKCSDDAAGIVITLSRSLHGRLLLISAAPEKAFLTLEPNSVRNTQPSEPHLPACLRWSRRVPSGHEGALPAPFSIAPARPECSSSGVT